MAGKSIIKMKLVCVIQSNYTLLSLNSIFFMVYIVMRARLVKVPTLYFLYR